jgi:uncharacterized protein (DUF1330 family)
VQGISTAYIVTTYRSVSDPAKVAAYIALAASAIELAGGTFLARSTAVEVREAGLIERTVVVAFESLEQAVAAYDSCAYRKAFRGAW